MLRVAVLGGGVAGCSIAFRLAQEGIRVSLLEKRPVLLAGSSRAAFGSLTPFSDPFFEGQARDFASNSVDLYRNKWLKKVEAASGLSVCIGNKGLFDLLDTAAEIRNAERLCVDLTESGYPAHMMSRDEVLELEPTLTGSYRAGLWLDEPWIDHEEYFEALLRCLARMEEITVQTSVIARSVTEHTNGVRVCLSDGQTISADFAVICTGPTADPVDGVDQPNLSWIRGDALAVRTGNNRPILERHVYKKDAFITPRGDGRMFLGASYADETEAASILERVNTHRISAGAALNLLRVNAELLPQLLQCDLVRSWRGWRVRAASGFPVLGPTGDGRVIIATGFIGLGVTMAPATAEAVLELVSLGDASLIPDDFKPTSHASFEEERNASGL